MIINKLFADLHKREVHPRRFPESVFGQTFWALPQQSLPIEIHFHDHIYDMY